MVYATDSGAPGPERLAHGVRKAMSDPCEERSSLDRLMDEPARCGHSTALETVGAPELYRQSPMGR
jgi:hypothetical protein